MMKKGVVISTAFILNIILFSACATTGTARKEKTEKYSRWLKEEVTLLITEEEEKEFMNLMSDKEKERFMGIFWAKKDPTPGTEEGEQEFLQSVTTEETEKGGLLATFGFPAKPGQYIFKVRITDLIAEKSIERETEFIVE